MSEVEPERVRRFLVSHHRLTRPWPSRGAAAVRELLTTLRCIQLDPLDPIGTNADLVALARIDGLKRGDVYRHLLPGHAFEHFAKERCLLPSTAFPWYRDQAVRTPWWHPHERMRRLPDGVLEAVYEEVKARGPLTAAELTDHGAVRALEWHGWKGTGRATQMALQVLWVRCRIVVSGRTPGGKRYDLPARSLGSVANLEVGDFARWAVLERVEAAGLLARASGPHWSMLSEVRKTDLPERLIAEGRLEEVTVRGSSRRYLAPAGWRDRPVEAPDDRLRILGPLDPLVWDRKLVRQVFDFEYVWEVYKPADKRRWGWYVCPLLHEGRLVGRLEARLEDDALAVHNVWGAPPKAALRRALQRHARSCGKSRVTGL